MFLNMLMFSVTVFFLFTVDFRWTDHGSVTTAFTRSIRETTHRAWCSSRQPWCCTYTMHDKSSVCLMGNKVTLLTAGKQSCMGCNFGHASLQFCDQEDIVITADWREIPLDTVWAATIFLWSVQLGVSQRGLHTLKTAFSGLLFWCKVSFFSSSFSRHTFASALCRDFWRVNFSLLQTSFSEAMMSLMLALPSNENLENCRDMACHRFSRRLK